MKKFYKEVSKKIIVILIENKLYRKEKKFFDFVFRVFNDKKNNENNNEIINYYILDKKSNKKIEDNIIYCDLSNSKWEFELIKEMEHFYSAILKCVVFHGALVRIYGKNILILGERWSGKTTLTNYLIFEKNAEYIGDDSIYAYNNLFYGLCMPLPLRNINSDYDKGNFIKICKDSEGVERVLTAAPRILEYVNKVDLVLFPKYVNQCEKKMIKYNEFDSFNKIIRNIRKYRNMEDVFPIISDLIKSSNCYFIQYNSSEKAHEMLKNILRLKI